MAAPGMVIEQPLPISAATPRYARLDGPAAPATVLEVVATDAAPGSFFHPEIPWQRVPAGVPAAPGWTWTGTAFAAPVPPVPTVQGTLDALDLLAFVKRGAGVMFQAAGAAAPSLFPTDDASRGLLTSSFVAAGAGLWTDGTPWETADGQFVPLASADVQALAKKALAYVAAVQARKAALAAAVRGDPTTDISAGWPSNA